MGRNGYYIVKSSITCPMPIVSNFT